MLSCYLAQFKWTDPLSEGVEPKMVLWTPTGMTQDEALQQLPPVCHKHLMVMPTAGTVKWLEHLHNCNTMSGDYAAADLIMQCIVKARSIIIDRNNAKHSLSSSKNRVEPSMVVWTPSDMTSAEALRILPPVCHEHLTKMPNPETVNQFVQLHQNSVASGNHVEAYLIKRCILRANCICENQEGTTPGLAV